MRKGLLAVAVTAVLTATAGGTATAWSTDNASRDMHDQMTSMVMGSMDMTQMDMSSMAGMHTPEMDALHTQMLEQMPAEMRAACDELHTQITGEVNGEVADHAAHHDK
jgi:hypothetical protein